MNKYEMMKELSGIDPAYIEEAKPKKRRRIVPAVISAAASLVLVIGLGIMLPRLVRNAPKDGSRKTAYTETTPVPAVQSGPGDPGAYPKDGERDLAGGSKFGGYSITRRTLAETVSRYGFIAEVRLVGEPDAKGTALAEVKTVFRGELPKVISVRFPIIGDVICEGERNPTFADAVRMRGGECLVFLIKSDDRTDCFFAGEIVYHESDGSVRSISISDIDGSTYSAVIGALPAMIRDNPYKAPAGAVSQKQTKGSKKL